MRLFMPQEDKDLADFISMMPNELAKEGGVILPLINNERTIDEKEK